jgi:hypothetical protein
MRSVGSGSVHPTDHRGAQAHLTQATQHLATAGALTWHRTNPAEMTSEQLVQLQELTTTARCLLDRIDGALRGRSVERELAEMLAQDDPGARAREVPSWRPGRPGPDS